MTKVKGSFNHKWMTIALLCAGVLFGQYSNSTLNGPWFLHTSPLVLHPDSLGYLVFDGNGHITDGNMFGAVSGHYSVMPNGFFTGMLTIESDSFPIGGQLVSNNNVTMGPMVLERISNPGALTDSLVGTLTSVLCGVRNVVFRLDGQGQIISSSGLTGAVSGRVYADSGIFMGHIRTGDRTTCYTGEGSWDEFTIYGTYSNDSLNGGIGVDGPRDSDRDSGSTHLVRMGNMTSIVKQGRAISGEKRIICRNMGSGIFAISMGNAVPGNARIQIMDLLGRKLAEMPVSRVSGDYSAQVDLSRLPQGIHLIRIQSDNKILFRDKILIE